MPRGPASPTPTQRAIVRGARLLLRAFFRRIEVTGAHHVPDDRGALLVAWHPNGLVDPGLVIAYGPRPVVFGARHGLFSVPLLGALLRGLGTVPIYRAIDRAGERAGERGGRADGAAEEARRLANRESVDALARRVAEGALSALFPEGDSHDESRVQALKTGAAHLYYRARELRAPGSPPPSIVLVGLHYDHKAVFRSSALVAFHAPMALEPDLDVDPGPDDDDATRSRRARRLTAAIEQQLHEVVHATEDWNVHHLLHRARRLIRAEAAARAGQDPGTSRLGERVLGFSQVRRAYEAALRTAPRRLAALSRRLEGYDAELRALGLSDYDLDRAPRLGSPWLVVLSVLQLVGVFLLLPPIVTIGYAANLPPATLVWLSTRVSAKRVKDEATVKLLLGALLFPATWVLVGVLAASIHTQLDAGFRGIPPGAIGTGVVAALAAAIGGAAAVRYLRVARESARAIAVRITRARQRDSVARLLHVRAQLHDQLLRLLVIVDAQADDVAGTVRKLSARS